MILDPDEASAWLSFALRPGVSLCAQRALLRRFGSPHAAIRAAPRAVEEVCTPAAATAFLNGPLEQQLQRALQWLQVPGHRLVTLADPEYPPWLLQIPDPPTIFYAVGRIELLRVPGIAIVGSRNATPRGVEDAEALGHALSQEGTCVVSGLALGIDAAAHRGALRAAGSSAAVLGTGIDVIYPIANRELAKALAREGCIMSEFPLGTPAVPGNFPRRNRLISGLVRGVVVIEAARNSGSLITARYAIDQGRDVFAVPGSIHSMLSKGCHELIKQGAKLVESAEEVLEEYRSQPPRSKPVLSAAPAEPETVLLAAMGFAPVGLDELARLTGLAARDVATQLGRLEVEGRVARIAGGRFQRQRAASQAAGGCVIE